MHCLHVVVHKGDDMVNEHEYLFSLRRKARQSGFVLIRPQKDMYGGYECSIQRIKDGAIHVVMNCPTPIDAAQEALGLFVKDGEVSSQFQGEFSDA